MSMKIEFSTDIQGFERLERALQQQTKLLNELSAATKGVSQAQAEMGKMEQSVKGWEGLKGTSKDINELVSSLNTLTKSQSGLKGFISSFGDFGKEMKEITKLASGEVFNNLNKQIDNLSTSLTSKVNDIKRLSNEIQQDKSEGRREDAQAKEVERSQLVAQSLAQKSMLGDARHAQFMHSPIGQFMFGGPGRGGQAVGIMKTVGARIAGGFMAGYGGGAMVMGGIGSMGAGAMEMERRSYANMFKYEQELYQQAAGGNAARLSRLMSGRSAEGQFMTGADTGENTFRNMKLKAKWATYGLFGLNKTYEEFMLDEAERLRAQDAPVNTSIDKITQFAMTTGRMSDFAALRIGDRGVSDALLAGRRGISGVSGTGVGRDRVLEGLRHLEPYGLTEYITEMGGAESEAGRYSRGVTARYNKNVNDRFRELTDPIIASQRTAERTRLENTLPEKVMMSGTAVGGGGSWVDRSKAIDIIMQKGGGWDSLSMEDRIKYQNIAKSDFTDQLSQVKTAKSAAAWNDPNTFYHLGRISPNILPKIAGQMAYDQNVMQGLGSALGATGLGETTTGVKAEFFNMAANQMGKVARPFMNVEEQTKYGSALMASLGQQGGLNDMDVVAAGASGMEYGQGMISSYGNIFSMGMEQQLIRMGVKNPADRARYLSLMGSGKTDTAIRHMLALQGKPTTGAAFKSAKEEINRTMSRGYELQKGVLFGQETVEQSELRAKADKLVGLDSVGIARAGKAGTNLSVYGMSEALGTTPLAGDKHTGELGDLSGLDTRAAKEESAKASYEAALIEGVEPALKVLGDKISTDIIQSAIDGYNGMIKQLQSVLKKEEGIQENIHPVYLRPGK